MVDESGTSGARSFDSANRARLETLLDELIDLPAAARQARLVEVARQDPQLSDAAESVLDAAESSGLLDRPVGELLAALLGAGDGAALSRVGERVGPYRLVRELGRGGMGTVYAAERVEGGFEQQVAVKVLKRGLDSEEVLRRFHAERRILARLAHPHIARLFDGGLTADGLPWFAMDLVAGLPITAGVDAQGLDVRARLGLFLEVCDAVSFAHRSRIVHRDLKPANVLLDAEGHAKLLDFGIAKLLDAEEAGLTRTTSRPMTPRWAAPEQVKGEPITPLTDVWQLGALLDAMLSKPLPRDLEHIAARARHEEPSRRYESVDALAEDVRRFLEERPVAARGDSAAYRLARLARRRRLEIAAVGLVVVAVPGTLLVARALRAPAAVSAAPRFVLLTSSSASERQASFSPDGESIVFVTEDPGGVPQLFTRKLVGSLSTQITRAPEGAHRPRWAPKGDTIVYDVPGRGIWSVSPGGGEPAQLLADGFDPNLSADGQQLVFEVATELWIARADGSEARMLGEGGRFGVKKEHAFIESMPAFSPDGSEVVFFQDRDSPMMGDLWSLPAAGGAPRQLTFDGVDTRHPVFLSDGSGLVYSSARSGGLTLWFLPARGDEPRPLTTGGGEDTEATISRDGRRLVYTNARNALRLMWLDPSRAERRRLLETRAIVTHPSFSPDGGRLVFFQGKDLDLNLWTLSSDGSGLRQLTFEEGGDVLPEWSADGRWIHYYRLRPPGFKRIPSEGGEPEVVVEGWRFPSQHGADVAADNRRVVYTNLERGAPKSTLVRELESGREHELALPILWPRWSPDDTWIVGRTGERELVLCPASGDPCRSLGVDGTEPRWSSDGRTVYFVRYTDYHGSRESHAVPLYEIALDGSPAVLVAELEGPSASHFFYDVSSTGEIAWASFVPGRQELWLAELPPGGLR